MGASRSGGPGSQTCSLRASFDQIDGFMQITCQTTTSKQDLYALFMGLLAAVLITFAAGCDGGGSNGNDGGELTAPAAPSGLTTAASDAEVSLDWSGVDGADSYSIYRATESTDEVLGSALDAGISSTSYTDESAENGTTYYYRVTAVASEDGETAESDGSDEALGTPFTNPTELEGASGGSQIELDWNAAAGAAFYNVYRSTESTGGVEGNPLATSISDPGFTDDTAENGTKYYYRVTSVNPEDEESSASNEVEKTPFSDPPRP